VTEGEEDHLFDTEWLYRIMRELTCARSVTVSRITLPDGPVIAEFDGLPSSASRVL
jgi:hypothetical protein